jgi:hypothetical protein
MPERRRGLYETLVTEALEQELRMLPEAWVARRSRLHEAEAADRLALHLAKVIERAIDALDREQRVAVGTSLARRLVEVVVGETGSAALEPERPVDPATVLEAVLGRLPDGRPEALSPPLMPLLDDQRPRGAANRRSGGDGDRFRRPHRSGDGVHSAQWQSTTDR